MEPGEEHDLPEASLSFADRLKRVGNIQISLAGIAAVCGVALIGLAIVAVGFLDVYDRHAATVGWVLLSLWCATIAGGCLLRVRLFSSVILAGVFVLLAKTAWGMSAPSHRTLERRAAPTISALYSYQKTYGQFPKDLETLGVQPAETRFGPWRYEVSENRQRFSLSVGDYSEDLFTGSYNSDYSAWYWDS